MNLSSILPISKSTQSTLLHEVFFSKLIRKEYNRIARQGHVYLDYTGGNLYAQSQVRKHLSLIENSVLGNPHSTNPTSALSTQLVAESRAAVLDFFNAQDYFCIFTANASNALKIVGECYPFDADGRFLLMADNHNSVNGIREYCRNKGGKVQYAPIQYEDLQIDGAVLDSLLSEAKPGHNNLFAYPAQSNVSGVKHDLKWVQKAAEQGWDVLLDAAAFVPSSPLDLQQVRPDFVSVSFYKIFGYPTGLGCLLVKKSKFDRLLKPWFAGGTVSLASVASEQHFLMQDHERFENGTINYIDIPAIKIGLDHIQSIGMKRIQQRVQSLSNALVARLRKLKHPNGAPILKIFGPEDRNQVGGTIILNFFDPTGKAFPIKEIELQANARKISIRTGCFCNPGIDEVNNCISTEALAKYFTSRDSGDYYDMMTYLNQMRGAIRISLGLASSRKDLDAFVDFAKSLQNRMLG